MKHRFYNRCDKQALHDKKFIEWIAELYMSGAFGRCDTKIWEEIGRQLLEINALKSDGGYLDEMPYDVVYNPKRIAKHGQGVNL